MIMGMFLGVWFMAVGIYSFYFAFMMKQTGVIKTGWIISRSVQLKESKDLPAFIEIAVKKTNIFAILATIGGVLFIVAVTANFFILMLLCMFVLFGGYVWYSSVIRRAEKKYLSTPLKKKNERKSKRKK